MQRLESLSTGAGLAVDDLLFYDIWLARLAILPMAVPAESEAPGVDALVDYLVEAGLGRELLLTARFTAVTFLIARARYADARQRLVLLLPDLVQQFGNEHLLTLQARIDLAGCVGFTTDPGESRVELIGLMKESDEIFGSTSYLSMRARMWVAACTALAGEPGHAIGLAWLSLTAEDLNPEIAHLLGQIVGACVAQLLESPSVPPNWREGGLGPTLQAAAAGEEEAFMRLPAELTDIVRAARAQKAPANG
ncbi:MAG TPA: hypothetical protein VFU36_18740 [Jatrophihabitans sp.]|nr:hypothetical protein [Jatrophihabitans sp.]